MLLIGIAQHGRNFKVIANDEAVGLNLTPTQVRNRIRHLIERGARTPVSLAARSAVAVHSIVSMTPHEFQEFTSGLGQPRNAQLKNILKRAYEGEFAYICEESLSPEMLEAVGDFLHETDSPTEPTHLIFNSDSDVEV